MKSWIATERTLLIFAGVFFSLQSWALLPDERNNIQVYKKANPAVVNITTVTLKQDFFFQVYPEKGVGSGVIVNPNGTIVTNDHVLGNAQKVSVTLHDKSEFSAKIIGRDPDSDLAVIKITGGKRKFPFLKFSENEPQVGQKVLAIGNPFGLGGSLTVGNISSLGRDIRAQTGRKISDVIQTDAAINPGNSGGPLINSSGEIVGINAQIFSTGGGSVGVGFAISKKIAERIVQQLVQFGQVLRPWLGLEGVGFSRSLLRNFKVPSRHGIMVTDVYRRSPAARAKLKSANREFVWGMRVIPVGGDVITQIDSTKVSTLNDLEDYIFEKKVGTVITIHYIRAGKKRTAKVKLTYPPGVRAKSF